MTLCQLLVAFGFICFALGFVLFAQEIIRIRRSTRAFLRRLGR